MDEMKKRVLALSRSNSKLQDENRKLRNQMKGSRPFDTIASLRERLRTSEALVATVSSHVVECEWMTLEDLSDLFAGVLREKVIPNEVPPELLSTKVRSSIISSFFVC